MKGANFKSYGDVSKLIKESWAQYVAWEIGKWYGKSLGRDDATSSVWLGFSTQDWLRTKDKPEYSPLFIDMIDTNNQVGTGRPNDRIALLDAYAFLNAKLAHCKSLDYFKEEMYNYYAQTWPGNAVKRKELDDYFAIYQGMN